MNTAFKNKRSPANGLHVIDVHPFHRLQFESQLEWQRGERTVRNDGSGKGHLPGNRASEETEVLEEAGEL